MRTAANCPNARWGACSSRAVGDPWLFPQSRKPASPCSITAGSIPGDLGYLAAGELYLTGREKDIIIRGGRNLYPQELEEAVSRLPGVRRGGVAVFPATDAQKRTERLVVLAEIRDKHGREPRAHPG